jgi:hypothetical protein
MQHVRQPLPELICVPPGMVRQIWPIVESYLDAGYGAADEFIPDDLIPWLESEKGQLWIVIREGRVMAAMTTCLVKQRSGLVLRLIGCGGVAMSEWSHLHRRIEKYAKAEGCVKVVTEGRPGWSKVLDGYRATRVCLEKRI